MKGLASYTEMTCCGVQNLGKFEEFDEDTDNEYGESFWDTPDSTHTGETWEDVLADVKREHSEGYVMTAWFVREKVSYKGDLAKTFLHNDLRLLVQQIPGVVSLGAHINPNTGNEIDGYMWINRK